MLRIIYRCAIVCYTWHLSVALKPGNVAECLHSRTVSVTEINIKETGVGEVGWFEYGGAWRVTPAVHLHLSLIHI